MADTAVDVHFLSLLFAGLVELGSGIHMVV
jgi:hypothetical protein